MKPAYAFILLVTLSSLILLTACPSEKHTTAILSTNRPEFTSYAELFNSSQDKYRLIIAYNDAPRTQLSENGAYGFDLVIDVQLNSQEYLDKFASLENLFMEEKLDADRFYPIPFEQGQYDGQQVLLPISFQIPGLMFHTEQPLPEQDSFLINLEQVKELNRDFSIQTDKGFTKLGLSLRWDSSLLYLITLLKETDFHEGSSGALIWNSQHLKDSIDFAREWTYQINDGLAAEREFSQKFLIEPPYKLIAKERILCYYTDAKDFYSLSPQIRENLKLRWLADEDIISVLPNMLFAGIPHGAPGIEAAKAFLTWFSNPESQEDLLNATQYKRTRTFGIAGGLSSLPKVNEQILPTYYPSLVGYIPTAAYLDFPPPMPADWSMLRDQVITPWLEEQAESETTDELLRDHLATWLRQRPSS